MSDLTFVIELTILVLAAFLGFEVISKVPTMLHTPLMSGTNFIHGIVDRRAIIILGFADDPFTKAVGFVAMVLATANVVGGWFVTDRMLEMFKRGRSPRRTTPRDLGSGRSRASSTSSRSSASSSRCASSRRRSTRARATGSAASGCWSRSRRPCSSTASRTGR
jgi:NAD(P) transhydrogenase subunit alpha